MTTAYWGVLIIILLPLVLGLSARIPTFTLKGNLRPRITADTLTGVQQRLYWAHLNALEAVAPFAAAIIIAHQLNAPQETIDTLALAFIGLRLAHALAYVANLGLIRTFMFIGGIGCVIALFVVAA